ncbi:Uncharacterized protein HZ326_24799 [Fusarium oxysporum f. sp. albedinis]|nr:Uncharacterized protein HZ326_24799 [Fusarium oxysporum f. sp. albedinis]
MLPTGQRRLSLRDAERRYPGSKRPSIARIIKQLEAANTLDYELVIQPNMGRPRLLSDDEDEAIVSFVMWMQKSGLPASKSEIVDVVNTIRSRRDERLLEATLRTEQETCWPRQGWLSRILWGYKGFDGSIITKCTKRVCVLGRKPSTTPPRHSLVRHPPWYLLTDPLSPQRFPSANHSSTNIVIVGPRNEGKSSLVSRAPEIGMLTVVAQGSRQR